MEQLDFAGLSFHFEGFLPQTHSLFVLAAPSGSTHKHSQKMVRSLGAQGKCHVEREEEEEKKKEEEEEEVEELI